MNRRGFLRLGVWAGAGALVAGYPLVIERRRVQVDHYQIAVAGLPAAFHGYRIAHLSDVHLGALISDAFVNAVVERTNALGADLIACTGDFVQARDTRGEIDRVWPILGRLRARDGVCSVLGNHDHWADTERSLYWLERTGQNLRHRCRPIYRGRQRIVVGGAGDYWGDELAIDQAFAGSDEGDCRILLTHNPDSLDTGFGTPLHLVLSGHTHGGQVVIPGLGAPVLPVKNKRYSSGLIATAKAPLFISRGIGWAIVPVRFNCAPQIALLELAAARAGAGSATATDAG